MVQLRVFSAQRHVFGAQRVVVVMVCALCSQRRE